MTDSSWKQPPDDDGGYNAIKGFAYQFDATLLEVFGSPRSTFELEGSQDLSGENYHIQIKNRSGNFYLSSITKAVSLMFRQFLTGDGSAAFVLHCHFPDQTPGTVRQIASDELDKILTEDLRAADDESKRQFLKVFSVKFSHDYEKQFDSVLQAIKEELSAKDHIEAVSYHAILHSYLRNLVLSNPPGLRRVELKDLRSAVRTAQSSIFASTYVLHCGYDKYLKMVRRRYASRKVNVRNVERVFSFECDHATDPEDIVTAALAIRDRYYIPENSPPPYVTLRGDFDYDVMRRALWDAEVFFEDGCGYQGGRFNLSHLVNPPMRRFGLKIVEQTYLPELILAARVKEFHDLFVDAKCEAPASVPAANHVYLRSYGDFYDVLR
ncbi:hypothetical protein ACIRO1_03620 [Streptomyces sp. NPDC102381]|uniref:hypothetical protein n=1 Tax=Streptomyces sp. NPDC102381 TaxID=3366164 RepID=UPI0037FE4787